MKKALGTLTVVTVLAIGVAAYAGPGFWSGGHMTGYGYGSGYGMGPGMMGYGEHMYGRSSNNRKFLDETADLRKELNNKRFEYFGAIRDPETGSKTITELEQDISSIQEQLYEKSPRTAYRGGGAFGNCW